MQETQFNSWVRNICWRRDRLVTPVLLGFTGDSAGKESAAMQETWVQPLGWEDPLEKGTTTHSRILAWQGWEEPLEEEMATHSNIFA